MFVFCLLLVDDLKELYLTVNCTHIEISFLGENRVKRVLRLAHKSGLKSIFEFSAGPPRGVNDKRRAYNFSN